MFFERTDFFINFGDLDMRNDIEVTDAIAFRKGDVILCRQDPSRPPIRLLGSVIVWTNALSHRRPPEPLYDGDGRPTGIWMTSDEDFEEDFDQLKGDLSPWLPNSKIIREGA